MTAKQLKNSILKEAFEGKLITNNIRFDNGLPQGWQIKTIGEVCEINPKNKLDDNLEVSFIPMNLILDKFQNKFSYEIKNWKDIKKGYTHLKNNCIALAKITPCFENGKCTILRNLKNGYGAGTTELIILLPNTKKVIIEYVFYFINTQYFIEQGKRNFRGTAGQLRISTDFVSNFSIPLPPIEEQKRIVNKLNELDKKFPERLKKSILKEAVQGKLVSQNNEDEPASELLKRIKAERDKLINFNNNVASAHCVNIQKKARKGLKPLVSSIYRKGNSFYEKKGKDEICIDAELPFEIPKSWEWIRLGNLCTIINGFTPLRSNPKFWDNPTISWFTVNDIHEQGRRIKYTKQAINKCALSDNSCRILPAGTVIICCTASVGEYAITEIPLTTNQQFNGLIINEYYSKYYLSEFLFQISPTFKSKLFDMAGKTTFNFISVKKLSNLLIPFPPIEEQKRIVEKLDKLMELCEELKK